MAEESKLSQEARDLLDIFAGRVINAQNSLAIDLNRKIDLMRDGIDRRIDGLETRVGSELREIKEEQIREREEQQKQSVNIARIEVRLEEGDRRMSEIESRVAQDEREQNKTGKGLAYLAGAAAAGGGITAAVMKMFGH